MQMRVRIPRNPSDVAKMAALGALIAVLVPFWLGDRVAARIRTAAHRDRTRTLRRVALGDDPDRLAQLMTRNEPVIVTEQGGDGRRDQGA